ncbi:MAG: hypothetical protein HRU19_02015 [Pseudobacteriovorax sp.]|nr:hypothetical protein [Pseudobacteriovorax sp.]
MNFLSQLVIVTAGIVAFEAQAKEYRISFQSNWNLEDHLATPRSAHFSPIVAVSHNHKYDLLPFGQTAGAGLENVAELGNATVILEELAAEIEAGTVGAVTQTPDLFINRSINQSFVVDITPEHPYLSFATMIAPSPDWMVGISNLKLYSESTGFYPGITKPYPLFAIDAGTESGDFGGNFSLNNRDTDPVGTISFLTGRGFAAPFAYITIEPVEVEEDEVVEEGTDVETIPSSQQ